MPLGIPLALSIIGWQSVPWFAFGQRWAIDNADSLNKGPAFVADFRNNRYAITTTASGSISGASASALGVTTEGVFSDLFTFTRAGSASYMDANGALQAASTDVPRFDYTNGRRQLLLESGATNLFLNSAVGATQNVTVSATSYVLSFKGTGSITLSGTGSGSKSGTDATTRVSLIFTPTAGTLTLTVAGSVTEVQLETGDRAPTSYIATTGSTASRVADNCALTAKGIALLSRTAVGARICGQAICRASDGGVFIGGATTTVAMRFNAGSTALILGNLTSLLQYGSFTTPLPSFGAAFGWDANGKAASYNSSTIASNASAQDATFSAAYLGRHANGACAFGWYDEFTIWPFRPTNAGLVSAAVAYT